MKALESTESDSGRSAKKILADNREGRFAMCFALFRECKVVDRFDVLSLVGHRAGGNGSQQDFMLVLGTPSR
jgi:hypothetical protein